MGTRERRKREVNVRRTAILAAARQLFFEHGFADTTMPDIAKQAELAPGTLYLYFPSKNALYAELLMEGYALLRGRLEAILANGGAPWSQARALIDIFLGFAQEQPEYFRVMFFILQSENAAGRKAALEKDQLARLKAEEDACKAIAQKLLSTLMPKLPKAVAAARINAIWAMLAGVVFFWTGEAEFTAVSQEGKSMILEMLGVRG